MYTIEKLQEKTINQALLAFSGFAIVAYAASLFREIKFGFDINFFITSVAIIVLIITTMFRRTLDTHVKVYMLILALSIDLAGGLNKLGFLASAKFLIPIVPVFISFVVSYRKALFTLFLFILMYVIFGILYSSGIIQLKIEPLAYTRNILPWTVECSMLCLTSWALLYVGKNFRESLIQSYDEIKLHNENLQLLVNERTKDLEDANVELLAANDTLKSTNMAMHEKNTIIEKQNVELATAYDHLKETQSQILQTEKMASLGTLTSGISHEINNPLNFLMGAYNGLNTYFSDYGSEDEKVTAILLECIREGVERISGIVSGLNQFSRNDNDPDEDCDIHLILNNCLMVLNNQLKNRIEVLRLYDSDPIIIQGNIGKLHQVFLNILHNASYAIKHSGTISIETRKENDHAVIFISDTGCGIRKEDLHQVTNPFFTTKPPGEGSGLGMSIAYSLIQEHNGTLEIKSEINKGTTVTIRI